MVFLAYIMQQRFQTISNINCDVSSLIPLPNGKVTYVDYFSNLNSDILPKDLSSFFVFVAIRHEYFIQ